MSRKTKYIIIFIGSFLVILTLVYIFSLSFKESISIDMEQLDNSFKEKGDFNLSNMKDIDNDFLTNELKIEPNNLETYIGKVPLISISSSMYFVAKATSEESAEYILEKLEEFSNSYEEYWSTYLLSEHTIVKNRKVGKRGKYVYLLVVENSDELEKYIN